MAMPKCCSGFLVLEFKVDSFGQTYMVEDGRGDGDTDIVPVIDTDIVTVPVIDTNTVPVTDTDIVPVIYCRYLTVDTKLKVYNQCVTPQRMSGSET